MRFGLKLGILVLSACAAGQDGVSKGLGDPAVLEEGGPVLHFAPAPALPVTRPGAELARDFLDLEFHLESGQTLPVLTRFDAPVRVTTEGPLPATARAETEALMARLRHEAGIDIGWGAAGTITLSFLPAAQVRRMQRSAACFVVPNVSGLAEWRRLRGTAAVDWRRMRSRSRATIFLPYDGAPQELRDCLHEEMAQALGPVNDLYRLPDSVFDDDNFHSVLTGFDMLMLRLHYAPELASGMTAPEVAARLPALMARMGHGWKGALPAGSATPKAFGDAVATVLSAGPIAARMAASDRVLALAAGWSDARAGLAWFLRGRVLSHADPVAARDAFERARQIYRRLPDGGIHLAHVLMQLAALDLGLGDWTRARAEVAQGLPLARRAQNAALIATFRMIEAEIARATGRSAEAARLALDSLPAARYGFGREAAIRARAAEIAALAALGRVRDTSGG